MTRVNVLNRGVSVEITPTLSVLNALLRAGVAVDHACGGKAECGTCVIRIVSGESWTSPVLGRERARLEAKGYGPGFRLACQTYCYRDIVIEIPLKEGDGAAVGN